MSLIRFLIKSPLPNTVLRAMSTRVSTPGPVQIAIGEALNELNPVHIEIINESHMHNVPPGSESHFKVLVVSDQFNGLPLIKRHRMVNEAVKTRLGGNFVHALSIVAKTKEQWDPEYSVEPSPNCKGGFGK